MTDQILALLAGVIVWPLFYGWLVANTGGLIGFGNMIRALYGKPDVDK